MNNQGRGCRAERLEHWRVGTSTGRAGGAARSPRLLREPEEASARAREVGTGEKVGELRPARQIKF
jgi:hypothetical protein